jgi:hypothetical protein
MGGMIPLTDASRRPLHFPVVTIFFIVANFPDGTQAWLPNDLFADTSTRSAPVWNPSHS